MFLLCRNNVRDYATWRRLFDGDADAHRRSGMILKAVWRDVDAPNTVRFLFEVQSRDRAQAFLDEPEGAEQGRKAGVTGGEYHFVNAVEVY